ncbi:MAG TPA: hopanoid biosynthesis associated radical SAM protein HpnJ [Acidobacteriota bacterium]|nr:hopanoid biosynthesis associated radical SAM protein HpnJ [Acidobacteriota bacterium]
MKTLLLNPPSFPNFDGGASSRWPATREIASFWYPVWLAYPAGLIPESRLLDAPPHGVTPEETIQAAKDFDFLVLYTSTIGFQNDIRLAEMIKDARPGIKIAFVGPQVTVEPEQSLRASSAIDFVVRKEIDYSVAEFARGKNLEDIPGVTFRRNGDIVHNADRPLLTDLDSLPFAVDIYKRDLDITKYNVPFLLHPYLAFYTSRGCPALCTFCLWPQTTSGHSWRVRSSQNVAAEVQRARELFPDLKEIFFDDDTFSWGKQRTIDLCRALRPLKATWSCTSRVHTDYETLKAMKEAGCRLLIVGFESGDPQILKNIKKGATAEQGVEFMKNCKKLGILVHGDFIIGLPGETHQTIETTMQFAEKLDCETIQVSIAHAYPGTEFYDYLKQNSYFTEDRMTDEVGHQLPNIHYPGLTRKELVEAVEYFYGKYYFRPRIVFRIVRKALFNGAERKRLYKEAKEFMQLRARRKQFMRLNANA